jgi:hypothetical protein
LGHIVSVQADSSTDDIAAQAVCMVNKQALSNTAVALESESPGSSFFL